MPHKLPVHQLDEPVGELPAAIEALVNDQSIQSMLAVELPDQFTLAVGAGVRHINVADATSGGLHYSLPIPFDPGQVAEPAFAVQGLHQNLVGTFY